MNHIHSDITITIVVIQTKSAYLMLASIDDYCGNYEESDGESFIQRASQVGHKVIACVETLFAIHTVQLSNHRI